MSETVTRPELEDLRAELDRVDAELLRVIGERLAICVRIAEYKRVNEVPMSQPHRIQYVQDRAARFANENGLSAAFLRRLYDTIIDETCRVEDEVIGTEGRGGVGRAALRIDHVAIAVRDLGAAVAAFRDQYGFEVIERRKVDGETSGMDSATMRGRGVTVVLCQGDSPASNVSRYIEHYGPGVQHIAVEVEGQDRLLDELTSRGADLLTGIIHAPGLDQAFTKRDPNTGIQFEFVTRTENDAFDDSNVRELFLAMEREDVF
jgi:chorismate mutase-like protein